MFYVRFTVLLLSCAVAENRQVTIGLLVLAMESSRAAAGDAPDPYADRGPHDAKFVEAFTTISCLIFNMTRQEDTLPEYFSPPLKKKLRDSQKADWVMKHHEDVQKYLKSKTDMIGPNNIMRLATEIEFAKS